MVRHTSAINSRRGFTLVESTIATVFLSLAVVGISSSISASSQQVRALEETSASVALARQLVEQLSAESFADLASYNGYTDTSSAITAAGSSTTDVTPGETYTRSVTVTYRATFSGTPAPSGSFATVEVTVTAPSNRTFKIAKVFSDVNLQAI